MSGADTIYALASGAGRAGVAVVRVSGPAAGRALAALAGRSDPVPRRMDRAVFRDPDTGAALDDGLVVWFPGPASFTGEDVVEFHGHGGRATVAALLDALGRLAGLRLAEPGEFTRRAVVNGRLDLTAAEGLADLVAAETEAQRRQALDLAGGALARACADWRARLVGIIAHWEAVIDFPDEDLPPGVAAEAGAAVAALGREIDGMLGRAAAAERVRDGLMVALVGPPNAGKSSLLNRLAGREAAIVSDRAGTTRDVVEVHMDLGGLPVLVADTAGLRRALDDIEAEGVRRALARAEAADIVLEVVAADAPPEMAVARAAARVINKVDQDPGRDLGVAGRPVFRVSARTGAGVADLESWLRDRAADLTGEGGLVARARQHEALTRCRAALGAFDPEALPELAAEDLRRAVRELGRLTGRVDVDEILDRVFADFCLGK